MNPSRNCQTSVGPVLPTTAPRLGARVGGDGRFRIRGVRPGTWDLLVHAGGHPRLLRVAIAVEAGKTPPSLELALPASVALRGRVVDPSGRGRSGVATHDRVLQAASEIAEADTGNNLVTSAVGSGCLFQWRG